MIGRMLGRVGWHLHHHSGQKPCGECGSGWPRGRRAQKRRETREWRRRELRTDLGMKASGARR